MALKYGYNEEGQLVCYNPETDETQLVSELVGDQSKGDLTAMAAAEHAKKSQGIDEIDEI